MQTNMDSLKEFYGPNAGFVLELYDKFLRDPDTLDTETRKLFEEHPPQLEEPKSPDIDRQRFSSWKTVLAVARLAQNIRQFGHLAANLDPLGILPLSEGGLLARDPSLKKESYGLDDETLRSLPPDLIGGSIVLRTRNAFEAIETLMKIYTSTIGFDFEHVHATDERTWLRDSIEGRLFAPPLMPVDGNTLLEQLTQTEVFEQFLQRSFPGKFRFSIEGIDMLVPMLDELVLLAAKSEIKSIIIGMAHRGRLNVLAHILHVPYSAIFAEFKDPVRHRNSRADLDWTGDVRYHRGAFKIQKNNSPDAMGIFLAPNPSHLEAIDPVIEGMARAAGTDSSHRGKPEFNPEVTLPILIHGDASFPGQGIVAETLNLSRLDGYSTGGTIHIITNNQLGYTATPDETRSTRYASDPAKGFEIPIIHVNADDPEGCIESVRIASAYREKFHKDFLIDLIGYRRHGHNESDEPTFTQPLMYERIQNSPTVRKKWADELTGRKTITPENVESFVRKEFDKLQSALTSLEPDKALIEPRPAMPPSGAARMAKTHVNPEKLQKLNQALLSFPENFSIHPKLERIIEKRRHVFDSQDAASIDWATAEILALSSILEDGIPIRFTGQDSDRGTFSHRHITFHDVKNGETFSPLQSFVQANASFEIYNSPLTESAAVGFEYGYNVQEPGRLVVWEAQYGDFINNAQTMVDEFITSARAKWGQTPSLILLLPHAYEGQGPDHSSGRLERFLSLAAEMNVRIANCTTAAQYFHLLRRQALLLKVDPLPLVVMTPKGLLRHPRTASTPRELFEGKWQPVIDDPKPLHETARRLILCSGKIFVDLIDSKYRQQNEETAIIRIEQLYPFPAGELKTLVMNYENAKELIWVQEGPQNMGAWNFIMPLLKDLFPGYGTGGSRIQIRYAGRPANASPSEGSTTLHIMHQNEIIEQAFKGETTNKHFAEREVSLQNS
ncbi:MAG TPA: 2-oxoglutarate dehydrogenase E1 component [Candidatus Acidoferrales bacterium]|nr:2-oxoglutarate dehydrogenase E1 component [Candidatus Acidoferrales bacterium]